MSLLQVALAREHIRSLRKPLPANATTNPSPCYQIEIAMLWQCYQRKNCHVVMSVRIAMLQHRRKFVPPISNWHAIRKDCHGTVKMENRHATRQRFVMLQYKELPCYKIEFAMVQYRELACYKIEICRVAARELPWCSVKSCHVMFSKENKVAMV